MTFTHELWRNGEPLDVIVRCRVYRYKGQPGTLSDPSGWECDLLSITTKDKKPVITTDKEDDEIKDIAYDIWRSG